MNVESYSRHYGQIQKYSLSVLPCDYKVPHDRGITAAEYQVQDDHLYAHTMRALFADATELESKDLVSAKNEWHERFKAAGRYIIEAL